MIYSIKNPSVCPGSETYTVQAVDKGYVMSVRATDRLIGDVVYIPSLKNSPLMIVHSVNAESKIVNTTWFANDNSVQEAEFPASALDRYEESAPAKPKQGPGKAKAK